MTRKAYILCSVVVLIIGAAFALRYIGPGATTTQTTHPVNSNLPMATIAVGATHIQAEVASNDAERELGLSNRTSLVEGRGMLFIFDPSRKVGFWMKDMHFAIDMIFADANGVITNIAEQATPESYPKIFPSVGPARYVLEVPAGYAAKQGIAVGMKIVVQ